LERTRFERAIAIAAIGFALALALFTGFRVPNAWSATLDAVSLFGGFHRRFVVGTLLHPLAVATGYSYWVFAAWSFLVLAALLAVLAREAYRGDTSRRLVIVAVLALHGGFLFNEVGYFEQVHYLLLFAAIWLVHRQREVAAALVMAIAPAVHEIAILTVLPLFGLVLARNVPFRRAAMLTAIPAAVNLAILAIPPARDGAIADLGAALAHANFAYRPDALALFDRTQHAAWDLYKIHEVVVYVRPMMWILVALFALLWWSDRDGWLRERDRQRPAVVLAISCAAIAVASLLVYGGWDGNRWRFIVIGSFAFAVWLALAYRRSQALRASTITVLVIAALFIARQPEWYFDDLAPRELSYRAVGTFIEHAADGSLFERSGNW
jgi:hypothetical protein